MDEIKTIVYTGNFSIDKMNAAGKRVLANALIMRDLGFHMVLVGVEKEDITSTEICRTECEFENVEVYHYPGVLFNTQRTNYNKFYDLFINLLSTNEWNVKAIIGYNSPSLSFFIGKVIRYCRAKKISYITDVADWLIGESDNIIYRNLRQIDTYLKNGYFIKKSDGVIAISTWLAEYYKKGGINNIIIVPPLSIDYNHRKGHSGEITSITYAGLPFRKGAKMRNLSLLKDRFDLVCTLLAYAKMNGAQFQFNVYGFSKDELCYSIPGLELLINQLQDNIVFHGHVEMNTVQEAIAESDYTILIREVNRMTSAGFPTKVSESISVGTPVITNMTSDISLYLKEGDGAFFIDIDKIDEACLKVTTLIEKSKEEREIQKRSAGSVKVFMRSEYYDAVKQFLDKMG